MSDSCDPTDCSPPGSSVHGISQTGILEWVAISFFRGSSLPRDQVQVSCIAGRFFTNWATREVGCVCLVLCNFITCRFSCPPSQCGSTAAPYHKDSFSPFIGKPHSPPTPSPLCCPSPSSPLVPTHLFSICATTSFLIYSLVCCTFRFQKLLFSSFHRWRNRGKCRLSNFTKMTELVTGRASIPIH